MFFSKYSFEEVLYLCAKYSNTVYKYYIVYEDVANLATNFLNTTKLCHMHFDKNIVFSIYKYIDLFIYIYILGFIFF